MGSPVGLSPRRARSLSHSHTEVSTAKGKRKCKIIPFAQSSRVILGIVLLPLPCYYLQGSQLPHMSLRAAALGVPICPGPLFPLVHLPVGSSYSLLCTAPVDVPVHSSLLQLSPLEKFCVCCVQELLSCFAMVKNRAPVVL